MLAATRLAPLALTHLNLDISNLEASQTFYRDVLRLPVETSANALRVCTRDYLLVLNVGNPVFGGSFHFGFRVPERDDVDTWIATFRAASVPIVVEPYATQTVYVARVTDPDGYEIEIYAELGG